MYKRRIHNFVNLSMFMNSLTYCIYNWRSHLQSICFFTDSWGGIL